jgi:hypothetical protein
MSVMKTQLEREVKEARFALRPAHAQDWYRRFAND